MAAISIRGLHPDIRERLRIRAATHGRSMEAEIRTILAAAVSDPTEGADLFEALLERFGAIGGVDLDLPERATPVRAVDLPA